MLFVLLILMFSTTGRTISFAKIDIPKFSSIASYDSTIAFAGLMPNEVLITMIICQGAFKIIYEIIVYPITRTVINWIKSLDDTPFAKIA